MNEITNREYTDTLTHYNTVVNKKLVEFATRYYGEFLAPSKQQELCSLSLKDKIWLLDQYKEELQSGTPDLSSHY